MHNGFTTANVFSVALFIQSYIIFPESPLCPQLNAAAEEGKWEEGEDGRNEQTYLGGGGLVGKEHMRKELSHSSPHELIFYFHQNFRSILEIPLLPKKSLENEL